MNELTPRQPAPCPICDAPAAAAHPPFCSPRCKDRDLLQWLADGYALPGPALDDEALDSPEPHD